jgi:hypothetical protein
VLHSWYTSISPLADRHREGRVWTGRVRRLGPARQRTSLAAIVPYKFSRELWLKGEVRQEWLRSNVSGVDYDASIFPIGLKAQR